MENLKKGKKFYLVMLNLIINRNVTTNYEF